LITNFYFPEQANPRERQPAEWKCPKLCLQEKKEESQNLTNSVQYPPNHLWGNQEGQNGLVKCDACKILVKLHAGLQVAAMPDLGCMLEHLVMDNNKNTIQPKIF